MSAISSRHRSVSAALAATSVALLVAACSSNSHSAQAPTPKTTPTTPAVPSTTTTTATPTIKWAVGTPLISDGTSTVTIGDVAATFPTTVTDAAWSPDGSRIAFIDGEGNLAAARADGSSLVVMAKPDQGSKLSSPAWEGGTLNYAEQGADGVSKLMQVSDPDSGSRASGDVYTFLPPTGSIANYGALTDVSYSSTSKVVTPDDTHTVVVFQHKGAKGPEIWFHATDSTSRGGANPASKLADGSWPAIAGEQLAFVGANGQIEVESLGQTPASPLQITSGAQSPTNLVWEPDGKNVAFSTPNGIESVPADGSGSGAPTQLSTKPGVISFLPAATDQVVHIAGTGPSDVVGASIALSQDRWETATGPTAEPAGGGPTGPRAMTVTLLPTSDPELPKISQFQYGPSLVLGSGNLDPRVTAEIKRVLGTPLPASQRSLGSDVGGAPDDVYIVGGPGAIPTSVDSAITALGYQPVRVTFAQGPGGAASSITAVDTADTTGQALAKSEGGHVIVTTNGVMSQADQTYLKGLWSGGMPDVVALDPSAEAAVKAGWPSNIAPPKIGLASGQTDADYTAALAASQNPSVITLVPAGSPTDLLMAESDAAGPVVVVDPAAGLSTTLKAFLDTQSATVSTITVIDSNGKLGPDLVNQLGTLISGPLGFTSVTNPQVSG